MFRSTSLRLAALYTTVFALAVLALGAITLVSIRGALTREFEARIRSESAALTQEFRVEGFGGVLQAVRERDETPGGLDYGLESVSGRALAGRLAGQHAPVGWALLAVPGRGKGEDGVRVLTTVLPGGARLLVGDDDERIEALDGAVLRGFGWALVGVVILGVSGGYALSRDVHRRLAAISSTAEAIIDGDLNRRVPVRGSDDDLDRLALTFNRMLDRIAALMESLKQVTNDVAHDLRTPLTRLRQKLETGLAAPTGGARVLESGLADLDAILDTFAALLRIAQIEGGARRAGFQPNDLSEIGRTVVDAFAPSAEEANQMLLLDATSPARIEGDRELLTQMLANLVENALRHAGPGARVEVAVRALADGVLLAVTDNGPGVPETERARLFDRFYRLEGSRSTPGSGLGLALVAAVARLHGAEVTLSDATPGLRAEARFPLA